MAQEGKKPRTIATSTRKVVTPAQAEATRAKGDANAEAEAEADVDGGAPRPWLVLVGILLLTAVVYAPALGGPFLWDDRMLIEQSGRVKDLSSWSSLFTGGFWAGTTQEDLSGAYFRPLSTLSFALDYAVHEGNPAGFHLTNLVLHLACVGLFFGWLRKQGLRLGTVALATSLWALAPRLAECVAWISGRTDVLAGLFSLGALRLWTSSGERSKARDALACALLFAGLLSKEVALAAVVACSVHAGLSRPRPIARVLAPLATFGVYLGLRANALDGAPAIARVDESLLERATAVLEAVGRYAYMIAVPTQPRPRMGLRAAPDAAWAVVGALLLCALLLGAIWRLKRREPLDRWAATAAALAMMGLGLVVHAIPLPLTASTADRFLYVPLLAVCALLAEPLDALVAAGKRRVGLAALALTAVFGWRTHLQARLYADDVAFWDTALRSSHPRDLVAHNQLGVLYAEVGMDEAALSALASARGLGRNGPRNYAAQLRRSGRCDEAVALWTEIVGSSGSTESDWIALARSQVCADRWTDARATLVAARQRFRAASQWADFERHLASLESAPPPRSATNARGWEEVATRHDRTWRRPDAHSAWLEVSRAPDATPEQRLRAAVRLLEDAPVEAATEAVTRAGEAGITEYDALRVLLLERTERVRRLRELDAASSRGDTH